MSEPSPFFEKQVALDAVLASRLPVLGSSRQGRPILGGWWPAPAGGPAPTGSGASDRPSWRLLVMGGIHGDEPSSVEAVLELVPRLEAAVRAAAPSEAGDDRILIVPALNPDGLAVGRKNAASDVDLNRNFPARSFTRAHRAGYDPGPEPLSEPETRLLARIIDEHAIDAVVATHAPFACVNFDGPARPWAEAVSAACGWPVRANIGYPTPGSLGSWLGTDRNLPVLTLELPPGPLSAFRAPAAAALDAAIVSSRSAANRREIG